MNLLVIGIGREKYWIIGYIFFISCIPKKTQNFLSRDNTIAKKIFKQQN